MRGNIFRPFYIPQFLRNIVGTLCTLHGGFICLFINVDTLMKNLEYKWLEAENILIDEIHANICTCIYPNNIFIIFEQPRIKMLYILKINTCRHLGE